MTGKGRPLNVDDLARRYVGGEPLTEIARSLGVSHRRVKQLLSERGIEITRGPRHAGGFIRRRVYDDAAVIRMYRDGMQVKDIAAALRASRNTIAAVLKDNGVSVRRGSNGFQPLAVDEAEAVRRARAGEDATAIAAALGCSRGKITSVLRARGIDTSRGGRGATRLARAEPERRYLAGEPVIAIARDARVAAKRVNEALAVAGIPLRGPGPPRNPANPRVPKVYGPPGGGRPSAFKAARTRQARPVIAADEHQFARMLAERGLDVTHQKAIGPYNVDLAAGAIAVEIYGTRHRGERQGQRLRYILDAGYDVIFVVTDRVHAPLRAEAAQYVVAHLEFRRGHPAAGSSYWVIGGNGQLIAAGSADDDDIPDVVPLVRAAQYRPGEVPEGTCRCGCGAAVSPGRRYLPGGHHNARRQYPR